MLIDSIQISTEINKEQWMTFLKIDKNHNEAVTFLVGIRDER